MVPSRRFQGIWRPLYRLHARATRAMTLGVRGLAQDGEGRIMLVEHTYTEGWFLPGGGVERGESAEEAMAREFVEEAGVEVTGALELLAISHSGRRFMGDHVLFFRAPAFRMVEPTQTGEILNRGWFAPDALPPDTTPATRARIAFALAPALAPALARGGGLAPAAEAPISPLR